MSKPKKNRNWDNFNRHLGRRLALRRQQAGLSADELDRVLCLVPGSIEAFQNGGRPLGASLLFSLGCELRVPVDFFFEDAPSLSVAPLTALPPRDTIDDAERFLDALNKVDDANLKLDILGLLKAAGD